MSQSVWKYNYPSGFDVNQFKEYLNKEAELHQTEGDGGKSTAGHENGPHEWPCNADFMQWLYPKLEVAAKEWDLDYTDLVCTGSWTNIHVKGALHITPYEHGSQVLLSCPCKESQLTEAILSLNNYFQTNG